MQLELHIDALDLEGQGLAHCEGNPVFVPDALPGEQVVARITRRKPGHSKAQLVQIRRASSQRVTPACPHFGVCGGCAVQHLHPAAQVAVKQRILEETLYASGQLRAAQMLPPIHGPAWHYRHRARLSVRLVERKGGILVGFRERRSSYVADMHECPVLPARVSDLLLPLRALIGGLSCARRVPQIEVAMGETSLVLVLRHLEPLTEPDRTALHAFGQEHGVVWWLQPKGPDSVHPLNEADADSLHYSLPEYGLKLAYRPTDFTQVNPFINRSLVSLALKLLDAQAHETVADMFCGLGNFSLPLATRACQVLGVEGSASLVERAAQAAQAHGLQARAAFKACNLFDIDAQWLREQGRFDRMLLDPPREGALALVKALSELAPDEQPRRLVYVSCNPVTLARDAGILVHVGGYRLRSAGVVNMFPHTAHIESIAQFVRA